MTPREKVVRILLSLILILLLDFAGAENEFDFSTSIARARSAVETLRQVSGIPGISVGVAVQGKVIWTEGFGLADLEKNVPATATTRFRLASVSKVVTAAAAARLWQSGRLDLDAPIQKYVPGFPEKGDTVTVRQLAGHLAGIRHYKPDDFKNDLQHFDTVNESLVIFQDDPLLNKPGAAYLYSTFGFTLLAAALEGAAGKDFSALLVEEVFRPLNLNATSLDEQRKLIPGRTGFYQRTVPTLIENSRPVDPSYKWAGGGILSNSEDLLHFGMAHLSDGYFQPAARQLLFQPQRTADGKETGVGFAWRIGADRSGRKIYHHAGNQAGARSVIVLYPEQDAVVTFLSNLTGEPAQVESTAQIIADFFLNKTTQCESPISGRFQFEGKYEENEFSGSFELSTDGTSGSFTGNFPLAWLAEKSRLPKEGRITAVGCSDRQIVLTLASGFGLTNWILVPSESGYAGTLELGQMKAEMRITKASLEMR